MTEWRAIAESPEATLWETWIRHSDGSLTMRWRVESGPFEFDFSRLEEAQSFFLDQ